MKLIYVFLAVALLAVAIVSIAGFRGDHSTKPPLEIFPDMNYQDKVKDQLPSAFFSDGNSARSPVEGTVAMEMPAQNDYWSTGKWDATHWGDGIPVHDARDGGTALAIDAANMARGRERYTISCAVCHGGLGDGQGITSKYGMKAIASYQVDLIRNKNDGDIFDTITNGKGQMIGLGYNIAIDDRWRIVMYIRALQHSQNASFDDASPEEQQRLNAKATPPAPPAAAPSATPAAAPAKSASNASTKHDLIADAVPPRLISDYGTEVGPIHYEGFSHPELVEGSVQSAITACPPKLIPRQARDDGGERNP